MRARYPLLRVPDPAGSGESTLILLLRNETLRRIPYRSESNPAGESLRPGRADFARGSHMLIPLKVRLELPNLSQ